MRRKAEEQIRAKELRRKGWSVNRIANELGIAKSSAYTWTKSIPRPEEFTPKARRCRRDKREKRLKEAREKNKRRRRKDRLISGDGRWMIQVPEGYKGKTYIGGRYIYEHRHLMEQELGRLLQPGEVVHHKNGDRLDNRLENLEILDHRDHSRHHSREQKAEMVLFRCPICWSEFSRARRQTFMVRRSSKHKLCFCSRSCAGRFSRQLSGKELEKHRKMNVVRQYKA